MSTNNQDGQLATPIPTEFFDRDANTFSYVVSDPSSNKCAVIDSVCSFDYASGRLSSEAANDLIQHIKSNELELEWIIESHVHADHISAAWFVQQELGGKIAIGDQITRVQKTFAQVFNEKSSFPCDGSQFDYLFADGEKYSIGNLQCYAMHTPGHTPACMTHIIGDAAFVGDTLFMPDGGTARADFPGGSAEQLYASIQNILDLPEGTRLFMCHDYSENQPENHYQSSIQAQHESNIHINQGVTKADFIAMRIARDETLAMPRYILPSLQINMRAGHCRKPESNGLSYLKIPLNAFNFAD